MRSAQLHSGPHTRLPKVPRDELLDQADSDAALITIVSGPGTGKSVFAVQCASRLLARRDAEGVWVDLREEHATLNSFRERVISLLVEAQLLPIDEGSDRRSLRDTFKALKRNVVIVLDNFHHVLSNQIENELIDALRYTGAIQLVITSRKSCAILTSASTQLTLPTRIFGDQDLAFSQDEVSKLLRLRKPELGEDLISVLTEQILNETHGWAIAVQASCMEGVSDFQEQSGGIIRSRFIREYVDKISLRHNTVEIEILIAIGISGGMKSEHLAEVLHYDQSEIEYFLSNSNETGLQYLTDKDGQAWYRHHDLIAEELTNRAPLILDEDRLKFIRTGIAEVMQYCRPLVAASEALRSESWSLFEHIIQNDQRIISTIANPRSETGKLLRNLPTTAKKDHPYLSLMNLFAENASPSGSAKKVVGLLKKLAFEDFAERNNETGGNYKTSAVRMGLARLAGNEQQALKMAAQTSSRLHALSDSSPINGLAGLVSNQIAITHILMNRFDDAEQELKCRSSGSAESHVHSLSLHTWIAASRGHLEQANQLINEAQRQKEPANWDTAYVGAGYRIASATLALEQENSTEARSHLEAFSAHFDTIEYWPQLLVLEALIAEDIYGPHEALSRFEERLSHRKRRLFLMPSSAELLNDTRTRLTWHAGKILRKPESKKRRSLAGVYERLFYDHNVAARSLAMNLLEGVTIQGYPRRKAELLLLSAEASRRMGDEQSSAEAAHKAAQILDQYSLKLPLRVLDHQGIKGLTELEPALAKFGNPRPTKARRAALLSASELRVLINLAETGTIAAAAKAMYLSQQTVKNTLGRAYKKLGVSNKLEAFIAAREAGYPIPNFKSEAPWDGPIVVKP